MYKDIVFFQPGKKGILTKQDLLKRLKFARWIKRTYPHKTSELTLLIINSAFISSPIQRLMLELQVEEYGERKTKELLQAVQQREGKRQVAGSLSNCVLQ